MTDPNKAPDEMATVTWNPYRPAADAAIGSISAAEIRRRADAWDEGYRAALAAALAAAVAAEPNEAPDEMATVMCRGCGLFYAPSLVGSRCACGSCRRTRSPGEDDTPA